jgi:hypothetical protein
LGGPQSALRPRAWLICWRDPKSMIRKGGDRFSEKIMLK